MGLAEQADDVVGEEFPVQGQHWVHVLGFLAKQFLELTENVRKALVEQQRGMGESGVVMAGRDIGTVVFPDADHKFFLVASLEEKVRRRAAQYERRGERVDEEAMRKEVELRDRVDSERPVAPLRPDEDAVIIDTDHLDVDQVVDRIVGHVQART